MAFEFELPNPPVVETAAVFGEGDLIRRSASTITPPAQRQTEVAKLIDISKCIGCKACQVGVPRVERHARRGRLQPRGLRQPHWT